MKKRMKLFVMVFAIVFALCAISAMAYAATDDTVRVERGGAVIVVGNATPDDEFPGVERENDDDDQDQPGDEDQQPGDDEETPGVEREDGNDDEDLPGDEDQQPGDDEETPGVEREEGGEDEDMPGDEDDVTPPTSAGLPQTGDNSALTMFIAAMLVCAAGIVLVLNKALKAK